MGGFGAFISQKKVWELDMESRTIIKKKIVWLLIVLSIIACFICGCSYLEFDNNIKKRINKNEDSELETEFSKDATNEQIHFVKKGEIISDYSEYCFKNGKKVYEGVKGLKYKINSIHIYNRIVDSKIKIEDCDGTFDKNEKIWENNNFIVIDMTVYYVKEEAKDNEEIMISMDWYANYFQGRKGYKKIKKSTSEDIYPELVYFSEHAKDGDINFLTGHKMKKDTDYYVFRKSIKPNESINFKLGVVVSEKMVKYGNVFLTFRRDKPPIDNLKVNYVDLVGEAENEKNIKN